MNLLKQILLLLLIPVTHTVQAQLKVVCNYLQDANGQHIMLRGVNLPVYHSGYVDDLNAVANAVKPSGSNFVRIHWYAKPAATVPYYYDGSTSTKTSIANLDRALTLYGSIGMISIVDLADLTLYSIPDPLNPGQPWKRFSTLGNDKTLFENTITAYWTNPEVVALINKHKQYVIINIANEWGSTHDDNYITQTSLATNFVQTYTSAIQAIRARGLTVPLMIDAPNGGQNSDFLVANGPALIDADPLHNTMLSVHTYWSNYAGLYTDAIIEAKLQAMAGSKLPFFLGEVAHTQDGNSPCQYGINYPKILTRANQLKIGYAIWAWYQDGCSRNIYNQDNGQTPNTDPASLPFARDVLQDPAYGISVTNTKLASFTKWVSRAKSIFFKALLDKCGWKTSNCNTCYFSLKADIVFTDNQGHEWKTTGQPVSFSGDNFLPLPLSPAKGDVLDISKITSLTINQQTGTSRSFPFWLSREIYRGGNPSLGRMTVNELSIDMLNDIILLSRENGSPLQYSFKQLSFSGDGLTVTGRLVHGPGTLSRPTLRITFSMQREHCYN